MSIEHQPNIYDHAEVFGDNPGDLKHIPGEIHNSGLTQPFRHALERFSDQTGRIISELPYIPHKRIVIGTAIALGSVIAAFAVYQGQKRHRK